MPTDLLSCLVVIAAFTPPDCHLHDRYRFPPQQIVEANLKIARARRDLVQQNYPLWGYQYFDWTQACADAEWRYACLDWCNAALGGEGRDSVYWIYSLKRLRNLLGDEAYFLGQLPSPIP